MHHRHPAHRGGPLARYIRAKLQRRMFAWFGATIVLTAAMVAFSMAVIGRTSEPSWKRDLERLQRFTSLQFARVWNDPRARDQLVDDLHREGGVGVQLVAADGSTVRQVGPACRRPFEVPVMDGQVRLGRVAFCLERNPQFGKGFLGIAVGVAVLWAASGFIARRLGRPLVELARVAQEIGNGNLKARFEVGHWHQHGEVTEVGRAVNDMAARIERQLADQRELLAAVSHELRTPLSRIRLLTEMARDNGATAQTYDDLDREVMEIDALVADLLASSRIDFAALSVRPLEVRDLAARALERAGLHGEVLEVNGASTVKGDATLLLRALANLIDNARRHGGGLTRLVVTERDGKVVFEAHDQGPGIAPGDEEKIFEPFHKSAERADGLGLGLSLVKKIALAHGGAAFAANRPEGGARVGIAIPS